MGKPQVLLKELTSGFAYNKIPIWFNACFYIILTDQGLTIWNWLLFRKITIPKQNIQKLISETVTLWGISHKLLRIVHSYPSAPKIIRFRSTNYNAWFEVFEKNGIPTEDNEQIRNVVSFFAWYIKLSFVIGVVVFILVIIALFILPSR